MAKTLKLLLLSGTLMTLNCTSDDNDCPDSMEVDINNPESIAQAEACGLSPAGPLGTLWVSDNYIKVRTKN